MQRWTHEQREKMQGEDEQLRQAELQAGLEDIREIFSSSPLPENEFDNA